MTVRIMQIPVGLMEVFCYLVWDPESLEGALLDPAGDAERLLEIIESKHITLKYIINTHAHADHTVESETIRSHTGAYIVMHALDDDFSRDPENIAWNRKLGFDPPPPADVRVEDGDELQLGNTSLKIIHTPGHTPGACCVLVEGNLFTGDTLFVGAVGRTDIPGASFETLLKSIKEKIITLPPETVIWPGHDYGDAPRSTVGEEIENNPYITDFILAEE